MSGLANLTLHHIGYAVRSAEVSKEDFQNLGAEFFYESIDEERNLFFQFGNIHGLIIELVSAIDFNTRCDITNMIKKQPCTQYHVCFEVRDVEQEVTRLKSEGFKQVGRVGFADVYGYRAKGAFLLSRGTGLIELIEKCDADE